MNPDQREAFFIALMISLQEHGSWCGETHIQKATYILQAGLGVPVGLDFVLYKHGPYSFDLHDLLGEMRADLLVEPHARPHPYGPTLEPTSNAARVGKQHADLVDRYHGKIDYLADRLASHGVASLERLGTALYVTRKHPGVDREQQVQEILKAKPHISERLAREALRESNDLLAGAPS